MGASLVDRILVAKRYAPELDPNIHVAIANAAKDPGEAMSMAGAIGAFGQGLRWKNHLELQHPHFQMNWWEQTDQAMQDILHGVGYIPPHHKSPAAGGITVAAMTADPGHAFRTAKAAKGIWHGFSKAVDFVTPEAVENIVGGGVDHSIGAALRTAGSGLRFTQRAFRAGQLRNRQFQTLPDDQKKGGFIGSMEFFFSPHQWDKAWDAVKNGEKTFDPVYEKQAVNKYGQETIDIAKKFASGMTPEEVLAEIPDQAKKVELERRLATGNGPDGKPLGDKHLQDAIEYMNASHITLGHSLIDPGLAVRHPLLHRTVTGSIDGTFDWFLDPVQVAASASHAAKIARYQVANIEDINRVFSDPAVQAEAKRMIDTLTHGVAYKGQSYDVAAVIAEHPRWANVAQQLASNEVNTVEKLREWFTEGAGVRALLEGRVTGMHAKQFTLPHITKFGMLSEDIKNGAKGIIDAAQESGDPVARWAGRSAKIFVTQLPRTTTVAADTHSSTLVVGQFAREFLPERAARDVQNMWAATNSISQRRRIWTGLLENMRQAGGISADDPWWKEITGSVSQNFSAGGFDVMGNGNREAFRLGHLSTDWKLPKYDDWLRASKRAQLLGINSRGMDWIMSNMWKPSVLLRPAFAMRAGGEEFVEAILRYGVEMPKARLAASARKGAAPLLPESGYLHPFHAVWEGFAKNLPEEWKAAIETPSDLMATHVANNVRKALRNVEGRLSGDKYLYYAKKLADDETFIDAFGRGLSAEHNAAGYLEGFYKDAIERGDIIVPDGAHLRPTGRFKNYSAGEDEFPYAWRGVLHEIQTDTGSRRVLQTMNDLGPVKPAAGEEIGGFRAMETPEQAWTKRRQQLIDDVTKSLKSPGMKKYADDFSRYDVVGSDMRVVDRPIARTPPPMTIEDAKLGTSLASTNTSTGLIRIDREALSENYRLGMRYERGLIDSPGSKQKAAVFEQQGVDVSELQNWFDEHGGARSYRKFVIEHEQAHILLEHGGTAPEEFGTAASIRKEIEANNVAFEKLKMPFGTYGDHGPLITDPATVRTGMASQDEAFRDWAAVIVDDTLANLPHGEQGFNHELAQRILDGDLPDYEELKGLASHLKPELAKGPKYEVVHTNILRAMVDRTFSEFVGRPMNWLVREPLALHNYAEAHMQIEAFNSSLKLGQRFTEKQMHEMAVHKMIDDTIPFIHDPRVRSQFAQVYRNVFPFWFAQEQFYKRLARTFAHNPAAFRKMQLVMNGFRHSGVIVKDDHGEDVLMIPVAGQVVSEVLVRGFGMRGIAPNLPLPVGFSGEVKAMSPGTERTGPPGLAPWVGIGLKFLSNRFPELQSASEKLTGNYGGRPYIDMILPSTVSRIGHALIDDPDSSAQMISAEASAMQYLEAAGYGYPEHGTADEQQQWQHRVTQWARTLYVTRAILGFASPASPQIIEAVDVIHPELVRLMNELGFADGTAEFVRRHPDWTPFQSFPTKSASGGVLPATKPAFDYMKKHETLMMKYPDAAAWLIPPDPEHKLEYDPRAYREQLQLKLRERYPDQKSFREAIAFSEGKTEYFRVKDLYEKHLAEAGDNAQRKAEVRQIWHDWSTNYKKQNPTFADMLESPGRHQKRADVLEHMRELVKRPDYPKDMQAQNLKTVLTVFDKWRAQVDAAKRDAHPNSNAVKAEVARLNDIFHSWAQDLIANHPEVAGFYTAIIAPDYDKDFAEASYG